MAPVYCTSKMVRCLPESSLNRGEEKAALDSRTDVKQEQLTSNVVRPSDGRSVGPKAVAGLRSVELPTKSSEEKELLANKKKKKRRE